MRGIFLSAALCVGLALPVFGECIVDDVEFEVVTQAQILEFFQVYASECEAELLDFAGIGPGSLQGFAPNQGVPSGDFTVSSTFAWPASGEGTAHLSAAEMVNFFTAWNVQGCEGSLATYLDRPGQPVACFEPLGKRFGVAFPIEQ